MCDIVFCIFRHLVECLFDAGKELEAAALVKVTSDFISSHEAEVDPRLFSIQVNPSVTHIYESPHASCDF